jgi:hypothetical protein
VWVTSLIWLVFVCGFSPIITMAWQGDDDFLYSMYYTYMLGSTAGMAYPGRDNACTDAMLVVHGVYAIFAILVFSMWCSAIGVFCVKGYTRMFNAMTGAEISDDII